MTVAAVINVRMGSTRLPGKVLRNICGRPLLGYLLARLRGARTVQRLVVATSQLAQNDPIAAFCAAAGVQCFRGSEDDVLARTLGALRAAGAEVGVVVYGDGPLVDPLIVDRVVDAYLHSVTQFDFVGNDLSTSYPPGMEAEAFAVAALADAAARCADPGVREHGTLYIRSNPRRYRLLNLEAPAPLRRPELELEVDTEVDLQVMTRILEYFGARLDFTLSDIIEFLDAHPGVADLNRAVQRRWRAYRLQDGAQHEAETEL